MGATAPPLPAVVHDGPPLVSTCQARRSCPSWPRSGWRCCCWASSSGSGSSQSVSSHSSCRCLAGCRRRVEVRQDRRGRHDRPSRGDAGSADTEVLLTSLGVLLVAGFVIQVGWIPPRASGGETAGASGAPVEPGRPGEPGPRRAGLGSPGPRREPAEVPRRAGHPREGRRFRRNDHHRAGRRAVPTRVRQRRSRHPAQRRDQDGSGASVFKGEIFAGVATMVYDVPLGAGTYGYVCSVHPNTGVRDDPVGSSPKGLRPPRRPILLAGHRHDHDRRGVVVRQHRRRRTAGEIGVMAPPIVGTTLDGTTFDLASYRGRPVIVNF